MPNSTLQSMWQSKAGKGMNTAGAILATLQDSGPATIRELCDTLAKTEPSAAREHVCQELHGLIRQNLVAVDLGIYSAV